MDSKKLKEYLSSNPEVQRIVKGRSGLGDDDFDGDYEYANLIVANGKNPKKWKRTHKFLIGSNADDYDMAFYYPNLVGETARVFYLEETDHVTILLVVKDNQIVVMEDLSD